MRQPLIQLTPEQREDCERQRRENPHSRRVYFEMTEEQERRWREAVEQELAGKEENIAAYRRMLEAQREPTLSGDLRRAIKASGRRLQEIADAVGVTPLELDEFRSGDAPLPSHVIDRLASTLGMTLTPAVAQERDSDTAPQ